MKAKLFKQDILMIHFLPTLLLSITLLLIITVSAYAWTVRGRLERLGRYGFYPVQDIPVRLCFPEGYPCSPPVYSDFDGMYYFYDVVPGDYILEIWTWGYKRGRPLSYRIKVFDKRYTDIPPIKVP